MKRLLAWLLWHANAAMRSSSDRVAAYAIKERILRRHGRFVGEDIQHIKRECYGCSGWGKDDGGFTCDRCYGTGIWDERWVKLERWEFGGHIFHRPIANVARPMNGVATVEGIIRHDDRNGLASAEALLWLALVYDRRLFWSELRSCRRFGVSRYPLLTLQLMVFEAGTRIKPIVARRSCISCGESWIRWFNRGSWHTCPSCARRMSTLSMADDDLPF